MWRSGRARSILTGGVTEEKTEAEGERYLREILMGKVRGSKHGGEAYPGPSPQTPPWSRGESWGHWGASFCLQWRGSCPHSASPPREAPGPNAGLIEENTHIMYSAWAHCLISIHSKKRGASTYPVKQQFLVQKTGLSTLQWWFHDPKLGGFTPTAAFQTLVELLIVYKINFSYCFYL